MPTGMESDRVMDGEPLIPSENDEDQTIVIDETEMPVKFCRHEDGVLAWFEIKKPSHLAGQTQGKYLTGPRAKELLKLIEAAK